MKIESEEHTKVLSTEQEFSLKAKEFSIFFGSFHALTFNDCNQNDMKTPNSISDQKRVERLANFFLMRDVIEHFCVFYKSDALLSEE